MHVLIVSRNRIPVYAYGGTERVVWDLGRALHALGHRVTYLVKPGSRCDFADVLPIDKSKPLLPQVDAAQRQSGADVVHFQSNPFSSVEASEAFVHPYLMTEHGNSELGTWHPRNTVFISRDHALRHASEQFVYNGLNWDAYGKVDLSLPRNDFHFLGNVAWPVKNIQGAIEVACGASVKLNVMGGRRLQIRRGFRLTWQPNIRFHGMVGGAQKFSMLNASKGMIFPVRWYEPFGLAIVESLYFGCPVFATPYGAIPELVPPECGTLSHSASALVQALEHTENFSAEACHSQARDKFNANQMAFGYVRKYEQVLDRQALHASVPTSQVHPRDLPWVA
jgi:glycosyltransferase involved in cell wall biosynthesis